MVSTIDVTKPVHGSPTTESVRDNFTIAAEEITELQRRQIGGAGVVSGDEPPNDPAEDSLWFDSIGCQLYVYYNDGTSKQWVPATSVFASGINSDTIGNWFSTLPTTPPSDPGQPWNNGGTLSFTY